MILILELSGHLVVVISSRPRGNQVYLNYTRLAWLFVRIYYLCCKIVSISNHLGNLISNKNTLDSFEKTDIDIIKT